MKTKYKARPKKNLPSVRTSSAPDHLFAKRQKEIKKFEFNHDVAEVFDDMVNRSIPFYSQVHEIIEDLLKYHLKNNDKIYDLGCSTGTTLLNISNWVSANKYKNISLVGIDNSPAMIHKCHEKWKRQGIKNATAICGTIEDYPLKKCSVVIMNYTLQFIPPKLRKKLVKKIIQALRPGGILIISEKLKSTNQEIQCLLTDLYYDFKRHNGYSELEISQKRQALDDVLIPWTAEQQIKLLKNSGFKKTEMVFRWYNFGTFIGVK